MTREQKVAKARELKAAGKRYVEIERALAVSERCVRRWTADIPWPPRECYVCGYPFSPRHGNQEICCGENARKRRHEEQRRGECVDCGAVLHAGSGYPGRGEQRCRTCHYMRLAEATDPRRRQIEKWWAEGLKLSEIAERLGWSKGHLAVEFDRMREAGYSLPYRYRPGRRHATKFPEQVPS